MGLSAADVKVGDTRTEVVLDNISRTQIVMYAGASGDYNPLHTDEVYVTEVAGYPTVSTWPTSRSRPSTKTASRWSPAARPPSSTPDSPTQYTLEVPPPST
jgi:hypothetical protein